MKERHALWDGITSGLPLDPSRFTPGQRQALHRFNLAVLIERTGWSVEYIEALELDLHGDLVTIYNLIDHKRNSSKK